MNRRVTDFRDRVLGYEEQLVEYLRQENFKLRLARMILRDEVSQVPQHVADLEIYIRLVRKPLEIVDNVEQFR